MSTLPARRAPAQLAAVDDEPAVPAEWGVFAALADNLWKDEFDGWRACAYVDAFQGAGFTPEEVEAAVRRLGGRPGGAFAPSASEISAQVERQRYVGTFDWAEESLTKCLASVATHVGDDDAYYAESVTDSVATVLRAFSPEHGEQLIAYLNELGGPWGRLRSFPRQRRLAWANTVVTQ